MYKIKTFGLMVTAILCMGLALGATAAPDTAPLRDGLPTNVAQIALDNMLDDAQADGWDTLTRIQQLEILTEVEAKAAANLVDEVTLSGMDPDTVNEWVGVGENIGQMMSGAAREVGVAANDFVATPVGIMTMGLIVWNYMGEAIAHMIGGLLVMFIGLGTLYCMFKRSHAGNIIYSKDKTDLFRRARIERVERHKISSEAQFLYLIASAIAIGISIGVAFSF